MAAVTITPTTTIRDVMIAWRSEVNLHSCETPAERDQLDAWERDRDRNPGAPRLAAVALGYRFDR